jgi:hypothetical protein
VEVPEDCRGPQQILLVAGTFSLGAVQQRFDPWPGDEPPQIRVGYGEQVANKIEMCLKPRVLEAGLGCGVPILDRVLVAQAF